jgi:GT2 family glycosyltransferase
MVEHPAISVAMPVFNPPVDMLRDAIESVRSQIYPSWELCIADDCSTDPEVRALLAECEESDPRIKVIRRTENGHISAASNSALGLVTTSWVACLDHDDVLAPHALAMVALAIAEHPDAGLVYSDEDKLDQSGIRRDPYFKPDFDPLLLLGQNFVSHLSVFRKDLVDRAGGYREGYEGSQDWDLTLRVTELLDPHQVIHIPHVLYHWRVHATSTASLVTAKPYAVKAGQRAVADHLERTDRDAARVERIGQIGFNRVSWRLRVPPPRVSVVVETTDGPHLPRCLNSLLAFTMYPDFEVVVVDNSSRDLGTLEYLRGNDHRVTVMRADLPGNHSAVKNLAVAQTSGDVLCFLSDNTEVISGEWLAEMVAQLWQPDIGAVGAKLYYADGRVEHGGMLLGVKGIAGRAHRLSDRLSVGYFGQLQLAHRMSAVSEACIVVRREAWAQVQGFDEKTLPDEFSDVDFCLRLREAGWDVVWTPYAELYHHESQLDDRDKADTETFARAAAYMETRWGFSGLRRDPYYNLNLSLDAEDYSLAWPPRGSYGPPT